MVSFGNHVFFTKTVFVYPLNGTFAFRLSTTAQNDGPRSPDLAHLRSGIDRWALPDYRWALPDSPPRHGDWPRITASSWRPAGRDQIEKPRDADAS